MSQAILKEAATPNLQQTNASARHSGADTMLQILIRQFLEHRMAVVGLSIIILFGLTALCAPLLSKVLGVGPDDQNVFNRYKSPGTVMEVPEDSKEMSIEGWIKEHPAAADALGQQILDAGLVDSSIASKEDAPFELVLSGRDHNEVLATLAKINSSESLAFADLVKNFRRTHLLGTDELGRDIFMRLIYGARVSIGVGILSAFAAAMIGLLMGTFAGYYGGWIDSALSRITDALLALPLLPLMIIFAAVDLANLPPFSYFITGQNESIAKLVVIIVLFSWMGVARLVRGSILSVKKREYVMAAKTLGASDARTIASHIIPNVIAPLLVAVTLGVGQSILFESALSFLGLGIQPPTPSWGNMLFNAQELLTQAPLLAVFPGLLIFLTVVSFNFMGDGLQDAIDPKTIQR